MKFINRGEAIQVRESDGPGRYKWTLLKIGQIIELPEAVGVRYGLRKIVDVTPFCKDMLTGKGPKTTQGKIGKKNVETKQFKDFQEELEEINGIGKKTAEDIVKTFRSEKDLILAVSKGRHIPFRDDIVTKLIKKYGGQNGR